MENKLNKKNQEKSECCGARMLGGIQCETCGSNGKLEEEEEIAKYNIEREIYETND